MKNKLITISILMFSLIASAQSGLSLLAPVEGDLYSKGTVDFQAKGIETPMSREAVKFSWAMAEDAVVLPVATPFVAASRGYWLNVTAGDLGTGVALPLAEAGALIRINPIGVKGSDLARAVVDPLNVTLVSENNRVFDLGAGMEFLVTAEEMEAAGQGFFGNTSVFRVKPELGRGKFTMFVDNMEADAEQAYVVHVFEKNSDFILTAATTSDTYMYGDTLVVDLGLSKTGSQVIPGKISGVVVSPSGRELPLTFNRGFRGSAELNLLETGGINGLWEVRITAMGTFRGVPVRRDVRTAFAYSVPTARFDGSLNLNHSDSAVETELGLEVASPGRYEARGVLFGTDSEGNARAIGISHAAAWIEAGEGALTLSFDKQLIGASGLSAPFQVKDLRLIHQNQMSLLHRQQTGFVIPEMP